MLCKIVCEIGLIFCFNFCVVEVVDECIFVVGVYGCGLVDFKEFYEFNCCLEFCSVEFMGVKLLYVWMYYIEDEFWLIYYKFIYDEMRKKFKVEGFLFIYDKFKVDMGMGVGKCRLVCGIVEIMWDKVIGNKNYFLKN